MEEEIRCDAQTQDLPFEGRIWSLRDLFPYQEDSPKLPLSSTHESLRLFNDANDLWKCKIPINDEDDSVFPKKQQEQELDLLQHSFQKPSIPTSNQTSMTLNPSLSSETKALTVHRQRVVAFYPKTAKIIKMPKHVHQKRRSNGEQKTGKKSLRSKILMKEAESQETVERQMSQQVPCDN